MIYRVDFQHFLTHMIDHFTVDDINHFQYEIISAKIPNGHRAPNVSKVSELYPTPDIVVAYAENRNKKVLEKMYMEYLDPPVDGEDAWIHRKVYSAIINPLILHHDIVLVCDREENEYLDILCKFLKKRYEIEVIDLNQLFINGYVGPIYIDRDRIWDKAVDIRRLSGNDFIKALESSEEGRMRLVETQDKKWKIHKLKELGIRVTAADKKDLDKLLIEEWVKDGG